jgi:hypothetical protein
VIRLKYCLLRSRGKFLKYKDLDDLVSKLKVKFDYESISDMLEDIELPHESAMGVYRLVGRFTELTEAKIKPEDKKEEGLTEEEQAIKLLDDVICLFNLYDKDYNIIDRCYEKIINARSKNPNFPITLALNNMLVEKGLLQE